ncbi:efflux RND transporter periplasmic adaptor subunit [Desulfuromonas sp. TF]|uniref:efflux RND transporter periplasmic adaptor subunit n=1 Tax=Desulfuromonas sp. TF TaxID=1232410 RepID=UPI00040C7ED3|nr:efflux RND transporter periplasmic adaptor subunit [Desulfuromonas sp. TF]
MTREIEKKSVSPLKLRRPAWMKFLWPAGITSILMLSLLVFSLGPSGVEAEKAAPAPAGAPPGMPVEAALVTTAPVNRELSAVGTLQSDESVVVSAEIAGRVEQIAFSEGEQVKAGQVLLRLDDSVLKAELDRSAASLGLSRANYKRAETLLKDRAISERERDEAYAKWQLDEATLRLAEANRAKTVIRAPFTGRLGLRNVSPGSYLRPGDSIVTLDAIDPIKVDFRVPEGFARQVKVGQSLQVNVDAVPGRTFSGEVIAVSPQLDAQGRSMLLRARLSNEEKLLNPGMFARVTLVLEEKAEALMIPEEALIAQGDSQLVYKVVDGKVEAAPVKLGIRQKGRVEIMEGVQAGDTVITAGHLKVRPGMPVTVLPTVAADVKPAKTEG